MKALTSIYIDEHYLEWFSDSDQFDIVACKKGEVNSILLDVLDAYVVAPDKGVMTLFEPVSLPVIKVAKKQKINKRRSHKIDIDRFIERQKSYPASKKDILGQAVGRNTKTILDATGGWGGDTLHLCSQGFTLQIAERNDVLIGFLAEALNRLEKTDWVKLNVITLPKLLPINSVLMMQKPEFNKAVDCVYLDPMFPNKSKRSALAKKNMQVLHDLVGEDPDQEALFSAAYEVSNSRVVVKRPDYAQSLGFSLGIKPSQVLQGKLMHYDIYFKQ